MSMYATIELDESGHQEPPSELEPENGSVYGQNLGQCDGYDELDAITAAAGVHDISSYFDDSDMLSEEEREEYGLPPAEENWSPIEDGINSLEVLVKELENRSPETVIGKYPVEAVLYDLRISLAILKNASPPDELFRIDVG